MITLRGQIGQALYDAIGVEKELLEAIQIHSKDPIAEAYEKGIIRGLIQAKCLANAAGRAERRTA